MRSLHKRTFTCMNILPLPSLTGSFSTNKYFISMVQIYVSTPQLFQSALILRLSFGVIQPVPPRSSYISFPGWFNPDIIPEKTELSTGSLHLQPRLSSPSPNIYQQFHTAKNALLVTMTLLALFRAFLMKKTHPKKTVSESTGPLQLVEKIV